MKTLRLGLVAIAMTFTAVSSLLAAGDAGRRGITSPPPDEYGVRSYSYGGGQRSDDGRRGDAGPNYRGRDDDGYVRGSHGERHYGSAPDRGWRAGYDPREQDVPRGRKAPALPLLGAVIVASDDTFLGVVSRDTHDPESIANDRGRFGDPDSYYSVWNFGGRYGTKYGNDSPWNPRATRPPKLFIGHSFRGYLSTNPDLDPRINPYWLIKHLDISPW